MADIVHVPWEVIIHLERKQGVNPKPCLLYYHHLDSFYSNKFGILDVINIVSDCSSIGRHGG